MKTGLLSAVLGVMLSTAVVAGDSITLRNEKTGDECGPINVANGARIRIGDATFAVTINEQSDAQKKLENKLKAIVITALEFADMPLEEATDILRSHAEEVAPEKSGVNILAIFPRGHADERPRLTMTLHNVSLYDAIRYCCEAADVRMRIDDNCVVVTP
jgi:hypothetical protein